ncbi:hypothetical protein MMC07_001088 [Pseudocyphellaria aurata]|nr:hypothetical protein [Pseudocyphellaria aurata]
MDQPSSRARSPMSAFDYYLYHIAPYTYQDEDEYEDEDEDEDDPMLTRGFDLSRHPNKEDLRLPHSRKITSLSEFRRAINDDEDGPLYLQAIADMVDFADIANEDGLSFQETIRDHDKRHLESHRILQQTLQELEDMKERSLTSQADCKRLQQELDAVKNQLAAERSSTSGDSAHDIRTELRDERNSHIHTLSRLDEATKTIVQLRTELSSSNYWPRGTDPDELLTGTDTSAYAKWKYCIKYNLQIDAVLYPTEVDRVGYALDQMIHPISRQISPWIDANIDTLTVNELFQEIEQYMGIHLRASKAKRELNTIKMKRGESVDEYFWRISSLWASAKTAEDERIEKFSNTLKPSISLPLSRSNHASMKAVLNAARSIEFELETRAMIFPDEISSPSMSSYYVDSPEASEGSSRAREGSTAKDISGRTISKVNAKFIPTSTKPGGWIGAWYEPERHPKKLKDKDRRLLSREGRCFRCRGSGHRGSDECCPSLGRRFNVG